MNDEQEEPGCVGVSIFFIFMVGAVFGIAYLSYVMLTPGAQVHAVQTK